MPNATQVQVHYNIVVEHTHKLAQHMHTCGLCSPIKACDIHLYLVDELHAAQKVYTHTLNRWLLDKSTVGEVADCAHHCAE